MKPREKRAYILRHLDNVDESVVNDIYQKLYAAVESNESAVGFSMNGEPIGKAKLLTDLKEAEAQIERGEYVTLEELTNEAETW
ncbi:hypothetical protein [Williamwhitmania taraxaci]|uniref:Uncharacterized protein n=1 Tax=Williamwhitmania taraxaci TaxID=1640674 RepID=A0A1G6QK15_9BACT|nr:hypothetical protein [Williamwhitmania taraxaci]SDC92792.1 hypothetical protein SAMN05216323_106218 [Williamwhitmania taraxaci]